MSDGQGYLLSVFLFIWRILYAKQQKTGCFTERDNELYNDLHYGCFKLCMVIFMTIVMTVFSVAVSGLRGTAEIADFFTYLPYNFTIALPIQMIVVAPLSFRLSEKLCESV